MSGLPEGVNLEFRDVVKTFRRGADHGSLRDALPALARKLLRRQAPHDPRTFESLRDINFQLRAGECLGIIGPNGAGKSTLLKCASRILRPNQGSVEVRGRVSALIEVGAGFHPDLTGRENIFLNGTILGMRRKEIARRLDQIVEFAGLAEAIDTPAKRYSSGMFARLGFAVAVFVDPDLLLVDEVLSVGDRAFASRCERKIAEVQTRGTAILFVSHNLAAIRSVCDRVLVLAGGRAVYSGDPDAAIRFYHELLLDQDDRTANSMITRCHVRDAHNDSATDDGFETGREVLVEIDIEPPANIAELRVEICLSDPHDTVVYQTSSPRFAGRQQETIRLEFRLQLNLLPGTYWLGVAIHGPSSAHQPAEVLEWRPCRLPVTVQGDAAAVGTANLFAHCRVINMNRAQRPFGVLAAG